MGNSVRNIKTDEAVMANLFDRFPSAKSWSSLHGEWVQAIRRLAKRPSFKPIKTSIVCSKHFTSAELVRRDNRLCLKEGAVPSVLDPPADDEVKWMLCLIWMDGS